MASTDTSCRGEREEERGVREEERGVREEERGETAVEVERCAVVVFNAEMYKVEHRKR